MPNKYKQIADRLLRLADVEINGNRPWDLQVHDEKFYQRVFTQGSLGLGESYMDGWWDCKDLSGFFYRILSARLEKQITLTWVDLGMLAKSVLLNLQSKARAFQVGEKHYDLGNELYEPMLGASMAYSCGYWLDAESLDEAQVAKFDLICRKMGLQKGMRVLDIGSGWGGLAVYAAKNYGVEVLGVTVSKEQLAWARKHGEGHKVHFELKDYRDLKEKFDAVVSVGMFEHVGLKNYREYFDCVDGLLVDRGIFLLHTIGTNQAQRAAEPWSDKYIFRNAYLPSPSQLSRAIEKDFVMEDWHNFGADYDRTLMVWMENFEKAWPKLRGDKYDDRFYRMWRYYLLSCAGSFRSRNNQLWQIVLSKGGVLGGYNSLR